MAVVRITYDPNLTNANVSPTTQDTNSAGCLETLATPTPPQDADYTFVGWYTSQVDGTKITTSYVFNAAGTIYAHWTEGSENTKYVQYDEPQQLTSNQKQMARENIDAATEREEYISRFTGQEIDDAIGKVRSYPSSPVTSVNGKTGTVVLKTSDIENDLHYITDENLEAEANARSLADISLHLEIVEVAEDLELEIAQTRLDMVTSDDEIPTGSVGINADQLNGHPDTYFVPKESGKGLSSNDYTNAEKQKVSDSYIKPNTGVPKADLAPDVQQSLARAEAVFGSNYIVFDDEED